MLQIPLYSAEGKPTGHVDIDPAVLGGRIRARLLKQAIVMYQANRRQNTSATKSRSMVEGSTRKLYRQKGTGNARAGSIRTNIRRGGGNAFAKGPQNYDQGMNKKMRRLARNSAILAKIHDEEVVVVESLGLNGASTKRLVSLLRAIGADRGCVVAVDQFNRDALLSARNLPKTELGPLAELNAYDVLRRRKLVMTRPAFEALAAGVGSPAGSGR
ncbi:MAG: 50S ribosomal protein L4 [Phycisphaerales bacterium]|nr:50S ribosomal protein L4 [Phycisphaerales bacterium]